jgi:hypothetical protein
MLSPAAEDNFDLSRDRHSYALRKGSRTTYTTSPSLAPDSDACGFVGDQKGAFQVLAFADIGWRWLV